MSQFKDLAGIDIEHLVSASTGKGLVKLRVTHTDGTIALGQIDPADARGIAAHLAECAARAEYEQDFMAAARSTSPPWTDDLIGGVLVLIRNGEYTRHTKV